MSDHFPWHFLIAASYLVFDCSAIRLLWKENVNPSLMIHLSAGNQIPLLTKFIIRECWFVVKGEP